MRFSPLRQVHKRVIKPACTAHKGFLVLELLLCIIIVALVSTVVWFNTIQIDNALVRTELDKLYLACHAAHNKAVTTGQKTSIHLDIADRKYAIDGQWVPLSSSVEFGWVPGAKGPPSSSRTTITKVTTFADNTINFLPTGDVSKGSIYIVDKKRRYGYALTISVGHVTSMRRYAYRGRWYLLDK